MTLFASTRRYIPLLLLSCIMILGMLMRSYHADFGLPEQYHPDETIASVTVESFMNGYFQITRYQHPPLIKYGAFLCIKGYEFFFRKDLPKITATATLALRWVSVISGTLAILLMYLLARTVLDAYASLWCAFLFAILPISVFLSKYGAPDMLLTFFFMLSIYVQIQLCKLPTKMLYVANGLIIALAFAAKYNAIFLGISFLVAHSYIIFQYKPNNVILFSINRVSAFFIGFCVGLSLGFPLIMNGNWPPLIESLGWESQHLFQKGHFGLQIKGSDYLYAFHFVKSIYPITGILFIASIAGGFLLSVLGKKREHIIMLAAAIPYYIAMENVFKVPVLFERYVSPLLWLYVLFAVLFWTRVSKELEKRFRLPARLTISCVLILLALTPLYKTTRYLQTISPDTRARMKEWITHNVSPGSTVFQQWPRTNYYPDIIKKMHILPNTQTNFYAVAQHVDYFLTSNLMYDRYFNYPDYEPAVTRFYTLIFDKAPLLHVEKPAYETYMLHNPELKIYAGLKK